MNLLLDTHVLIWALENNPTLSGNARNAIIKASNMIFCQFCLGRGNCYQKKPG